MEVWGQGDISQPDEEELRREREELETITAEATECAMESQSWEGVV